MRRALAIVLCVIGAAIGSPLDFAGGVRAIEKTLDTRTLQEAIDLGQTSVERTRTRFHADYRFVVGRAPVDFIDIVTPYRRVVIAAESGARTGRRMFSQRDALATLGPDRERVELYVELTFHPLNTFVGVPDYGVTLKPTRPGAPAGRPMTIDRIPRFGPRVEGEPLNRSLPYPIPPRLPTGGQPVSGGTLIAGFDGPSLDPKGTYDAIVDEHNKELASVRVDLSRLR